MRLSQSTHLLMCLSLETFTSIKRTGQTILVELIDLMNSVIIFSAMISDDLTLDFFLSFGNSIVLQWLSLHWDTLIVLLSQFPLTFHQIHNMLSRFIAELMTMGCHLRDVPWEDIFKLSSSAAACEFFNGFRLELMYISFIPSIRRSLTYLHGFQLLVLLP